MGRALCGGAALTAAIVLVFAGAAGAHRAAYDPEQAASFTRQAISLEEQAIHDLDQGQTTSSVRGVIHKSQALLADAQHEVDPGSAAGHDLGQAIKEDNDAAISGDPAPWLRRALPWKNKAVAALTRGEPSISVTAFTLSKDAGANSIAIANVAGKTFAAVGLYNANGIAVIEDGKLKQVPVPTANSGIRDVLVNPNGTVIFSENNASKLGEISPSGAVSEIPLAPGAQPFGLVFLSGSAWFTEGAGNMIGRLAPNGTITTFPVPQGPNNTAPYPNSITSGPDGALWFTNEVSDQIGRITTSGAITTFNVPTPQSYPAAIAPGPGGLWFTEFTSGKIGLITPAGKITEFSTGSAKTQPDDIVKGPDGNMWFTEYAANAVAEITPAGKVIPVKLPGLSGPTGIAALGHMVFVAEYSADKVFELNVK